MQFILFILTFMYIYFNWSNYFLFFVLCKAFNNNPWARIKSIPLNHLTLLSFCDITWELINHITLHRFLIKSVRFKILLHIIENIIFLTFLIKLIWASTLSLSSIVCISCTKVLKDLSVLLSLFQLKQDLFTYIVFLGLIIILQFLFIFFQWCFFAYNLNFIIVYIYI